MRVGRTRLSPRPTQFRLKNQQTTDNRQANQQTTYRGAQQLRISEGSYLVVNPRLSYTFNRCTCALLSGRYLELRIMPLLCWYCSFRSQGKKSLLQHVRDVHSLEPRFSIDCAVCGQCFRVFSSYTSHVSRKHPGKSCEGVA